MMSFGYQKVIPIFGSQEKLGETMSNIVAIIMSADGLVPLGARTSTGTVITKVGFCMYMRQGLQGLVDSSWLGDACILMG